MPPKCQNLLLPHYIQLKNTKPKAKPYKLFDGGGLYIEVMPIGTKLWRMKFRQANGKESRLAFGGYPEVSISEARKKRSAAHSLLTDGIDPAQDRQQRKLLSQEA